MKFLVHIVCNFMNHIEASIMRQFKINPNTRPEHKNRKQRRSTYTRTHSLKGIDEKSVFNYHMF